MTIFLDITSNFTNWLSCDWNGFEGFFLWLVQGIGYLFALMVVGAIIVLIRLMFQRDKTGREMRGCGVFYLILFGIPIMIGLCIGLYNRKEKPASTNTFVITSSSYSGAHSWSSKHLEKISIDDLGWDDTVWICTSGSSKKFHSTLECPGMQNCSSEADAITREEAEDMGRTNCWRCYY